ncbi:hypothetical protein CP993_25330, partial [Escherichia coli]
MSTKTRNKSSTTWWVPSSGLAPEGPRRIDFELILWYAQVLIRKQPQIAALLSQVFSYILVDEYQDTKQIQYNLVGAILRAGAGRTKT